MPDLESVYSATADTARLLGAPCDRDALWPILRAYEAGFTGGAVALRTTTRARRSGELSVRYIGPAGDPDPYRVALDQGFTVEADRPAGRLYREIQDRGGVGFRGVDVGVASGFEKIWSIYADDGGKTVEAMSRTPGMPPSVGGNLDYFARHGLTGINGIAVDYRSHSVNVYFPFTGARDAQKISTMIEDLGFRVPGNDELDLCCRAFSVYFTFPWNSPNIERICFPVRTPAPDLVPAHLDPLIGRFVRGARFHDGDRAYVYALAFSGHGPYYKIENFYHRPAPMIETDRLRTPLPPR
jgi:hypothetical protein